MIAFSRLLHAHTVALPAPLAAFTGVLAAVMMGALRLLTLFSVGTLCLVFSIRNALAPEALPEVLQSVYNRLAIPKEERQKCR